MGKKIIGIIAFAAIAVTAVWNYQQKKQNVELSDLALENIEALARSEGPGIDQDGYKYVAEPKPCCKKYTHEYKCSDVWPDC